MAPSQSRQLLIWTIPTIAVLLSYLWYKRKRTGSKSDPGYDRSTTPTITREESPFAKTDGNVTAVPAKPRSLESSPNRNFSRSLSGVDSAPIDIVIPHNLKSVKTTPIVISDEDLDLEIEKIKSMRPGTSVDLKKLNTPVKEIKFSKTTPIKESFKFSPVIVKMQSPNMEPTEQKSSVPSVSNSPKESAKSVVKAQSVEDGCSKEELQRQTNERDSANHSPSDVMMASPSLSSISDNHSEGSNDSGKGESDVLTPPPSRTPGAESTSVSDLLIYEFGIPQTLVGKLIGKHGNFVTAIKDKAGAHVVVRKHPTNNKMKICMIEGTRAEIDRALKMIRDKFPLKRFPEVTLEQVAPDTVLSSVPLAADHLYLKLIEGINNDTVISCMVSPNHLFLQQPYHPTHPNLIKLTEVMNVVYADADAPLLPTPIPENTVCVAFSVDSWHRALILSTDEENGTSFVKFLDCGGYGYADNSGLRQIRGDFMMLPFQAAECILSNIKPVGESKWADEAYRFVAEMTQATIMATQIADYTEDGTALVCCYFMLPGKRHIVCLNEELVKHGYAEWIQPIEQAATVAEA